MCVLSVRLNSLDEHSHNHVQRMHAHPHATELWVRGQGSRGKLEGRDRKRVGGRDEEEKSGGGSGGERDHQRKHCGNAGRWTRACLFQRLVGVKIEKLFFIQTACCLQTLADMSLKFERPHTGKEKQF